MNKDREIEQLEKYNGYYHSQLLDLEQKFYGYEKEVNKKLELLNSNLTDLSNRVTEIEAILRRYFLD